MINKETTIIDDKQQVCKFCKYSWIYKGNKLYATCPNCLNKIEVNK